MKKSLTAALAAVALLTGATTLLRQPSSRPIVVRTATAVAPEPLVTEEGSWPTTTTPATVAPVASLATTDAAPVVVARKTKPRITTAARLTPTTLDPNEVVWIRDGRGYCGQTSRASADPAAIDSSCPANQPEPLEGHAANPDAEDENDVVYVYENGYCKPMGRAESGQEHNSPECVGYTEGVKPYDESTTTTTAP